MVVLRMSSYPVLSIMIPAYNYSVGVKRILDNIPLELLCDSVEVLVYDNSTDSSVCQLVKKYPNVLYKHKRVKYGAVENWNDLLDSARGEYFLLVHHDEYFSREFIPSLLSQLNSKCDGYILDLKLVSSDGAHFSHLPTVMRRFSYCFPQYLYRRNLIGPCACLVYKRCQFRFDFNLKWLVDVDFYSRVISQGGRFEYLSVITIYSEVDYTGSITNDISSDVKSLAIKEIDYIRRRDGNSASNSILRRLFFCYPITLIEISIWSVFRVFYNAIREKL